MRLISVQLTLCLFQVNLDCFIINYVYISGLKSNTVGSEEKYTKETVRCKRVLVLSELVSGFNVNHSKSAKQ